MKESAKIKKLSEYKCEQLPLPFMFDRPEPNYSHTIELYDAVPKYVWGRIALKDRKSGQFLDSIKRKFEFRGKVYRVKITPARIEEKGLDMDYFPGEMEELIEDALRKLACDGKGLFLDDQAGVVFTLYELQQELNSRGHKYNIAQIKRSIQICRGTSIILESETGDSILESQMFETVGLQTQEDWKGQGKKTKCFVRFNSLVTRSIKSKTYRQLNYDTCMAYKRSLSRWINKRMSHMFIQASMVNNYTILLSTIIRNSCVKEYKDMRNNLRDVRSALDEMKEAGVIRLYKEDIIKDGRKIADVKFSISPGISFISDMKKANAIKKITG
jgi:hypothetical protein